MKRQLQAYYSSYGTVATSCFVGDTKCANREGRGDCSDVCLPGSQGQTCRCDNGKQLESNAKTCENGNCFCPCILNNAF